MKKELYYHDLSFKGNYYNIVFELFSLSGDLRVQSETAIHMDKAWITLSILLPSPPTVLLVESILAEATTVKH